MPAPPISTLQLLAEAIEEEAIKLAQSEYKDDTTCSDEWPDSWHLRDNDRRDEYRRRVIDKIIR